MSKQTTVTVTCDLCEQEIDENENYVNAQVYGADFHAKCLDKYSGINTIIALGLDDIKYDNTGDKVIYYTPDGTHRDRK